MFVEFADDVQFVQTECNFSEAMNRIRKKDPEAKEDDYCSLWDAIALSVKNDGYKSAMDYIRHANLVAKTEMVNNRRAI